MLAVDPAEGPGVRYAWDTADTTRRQGYTAFGTERYNLGGDLPTRYQFTGQRGFEEIGLQYYGARWYDGALGRFSQADTIIPEPGNPMAWDRFAYSRNSPTMYIDPTGHAYCASHVPGAMCMNDNPDPVYYSPPLTPTPTEVSVPDQTPVPTPIQTPSTFWNSVPTSTPTSATVLACTDSGPSDGCPSISDPFAWLRQITDLTDPVLLGETTGTSIDYLEALKQTGQLMELYQPGNTFSKVIILTAPAIPLLSTGYNFVYDQVTQTGPYSSIELSVTQAVYVGISVTIVIIPIMIASPLP